MSNDQMDRLESKLNIIMRDQSRILELLNKLLPSDSDDPHLSGYLAHTVTEVEHYVSGSGNPTWKAFTTDGEIIYLRQAHKRMLSESALWDELNRMSIGDRWKITIELGTIPDGDFLKPIYVGAWRYDESSLYQPFTVNTGVSDDDAFGYLRDIIKSGDFVVLDTETADLHGHVVQVAIIDSNEKTLLNRLVKPPEPISSGAASIHGITNEMVANAVVFSDVTVADAIYEILSKYQVVGWNIGYDIRCLKLSSDHYGVKQLSSLLMKKPQIDLMTAYSTHVAKEWSDYHQDYRFQKLISAAAHYGISTNGAHNALADCQMTLAVMKAMVG